MKKLVIILIVFSILMNLYVLLLNQKIITFFSPDEEIKRTGTVSLIILDRNFRITIQSPENKTYNFDNIGDYFIDLNVSANQEAENWLYVLRDIKHEEETTGAFIPNITLNAYRWGNKLTIYATDSYGREANASVDFFVNVPNHAPRLEFNDSEVLICERNTLNHKINASDVDEDSLVFDLNPKDPFFVNPANPASSLILINRSYVSFAQTSIVSSVLNKNHIGKYAREISVTDGEYSDSKLTNITVIEINNAPEFERIGVQTVYSKGENNSFYKQLNVNDEEDENNPASGKFSYKLDFLQGNRFFDITESGVMNFTANESVIGNYEIKVFVTDQALPDARIHQNISICGQDGKNQTVSEIFWLTITNENRRPRIVQSVPSELNFSANGKQELYFNISSYDPDGTMPDTFWYVDGILKGNSSLSNFSEFRHAFDCDVSGEHKIKVEVTDSLLNDSLQWNINIRAVSCVVVPGGGSPGGGGGSGQTCETKWICNDWLVCESTDQTLQTGIIQGELYRIIRNSCDRNYWTGEKCGFQKRTCFDLNSCNKIQGKPEEIQACWYTENPTCSDGIKNCHDGKCEFLIDCGGPCNACPTCSDGIQNQGEEKADCGGPCPNKCPVEIPLPVRVRSYSWLVIIFIALIVLAIMTYKVWKKRKEVSNY